MNDKKIIELYCVRNKSMAEIADMYNTYPNKIRRLLLKHGVKILTKSEAQKNALKNGRSKIPTQGRKRSKEEKLKISKSMKKNWEQIDEEEYNRRVELAKNRWDKMPEEEKNKMKQLGFQAIRKASKEGSKLERYIKRELTSLGYNVLIHQKILPNKDLEVDLFLPSEKTIIEVDGPSHFLPVWGEERLQKQIKSDQDKTGLALSKGFKIIRIKHLKDGLCLSDRENLKAKVIDLLKVDNQKSNYIEIEA